MKKLSQIIDCDYDIEIKEIKINSKEIEPGDLFVCTKGVNADRHDFIDDAIKNGAVAVIVSRDVNCSVPMVKVSDTNKILPIICSKFYDNPEKKYYDYKKAQAPLIAKQKEFEKLSRFSLL